MATEEQKLSLEQKELVAVGASVGAGCHPCVDHHLKTGAEAGLDGEHLLAAVTSAERVAAEAAVLMGDHARGKLGRSVAEPALLARIHLREAERLLDALGAPVAAPENDADSGDGCGCGADKAAAPLLEAQTPGPAGRTSDDDTATNQASGPARGSMDSMAELFATADSGELSGIAAAMANCNRMFEGACRRPAAPAETNEPPTAAQAAGSCKKEV